MPRRLSLLQSGGIPIIRQRRNPTENQLGEPSQAGWGKIEQQIDEVLLRTMDRRDRIRCLNCMDLASKMMWIPQAGDDWAGLQEKNRRQGRAGSVYVLHPVIVRTGAPEGRRAGSMASPSHRGGQPSQETFEESLDFSTAPGPNRRMRSPGARPRTLLNFWTQC